MEQIHKTSPWEQVFAKMEQATLLSLQNQTKRYANNIRGSIERFTDSGYRLMRNTSVDGIDGTAIFIKESKEPNTLLYLLVTSRRGGHDYSAHETLVNLSLIEEFLV